MLGFLQDQKHKGELRASRDEILCGEIITLMVEKGHAPIGFSADSDYQRMRFRTCNDPVLYSMTITLDRKTGGNVITSAIVGDKATLQLLAEVKNFIADPDDLLKMIGTDLKNLFKIPLMGGIKVDHQLNSIIAYTTEIIEIKKYILKGEQGRRDLDTLLSDKINRLRDTLGPFKKSQI